MEITTPRTVLPCSEVWGGNGQIRRGVSLPGLEGAVLSQPCLSGQGGDVYYVSACSAGVFARVYLADVVGHGEQVSQMSAWLHDTLRRRINYHATDRIFADVNRHVLKRGYEALTTAACFTYDAKHGELNYCYAGHPPMLRFDRAARRWETLQPGHNGKNGVHNIAFGVTEDAAYDVGRSQLNPGDLLILYSDGLTEVPNPERILFGVERLLECLGEHPAGDCTELVDQIMNTLHTHAGKNPLDHDDVTILAFRVEPPLEGSILRIAIQNRIRRWHLHHSPNDSPTE